MLLLLPVAYLQSFYIDGIVYLIVGCLGIIHGIDIIRNTFIMNLPEI